MRFSPKITSSCIWVAIPVDWDILHWYACGADGRASVGHITKISRMGDYHIFLPMVLRFARFARESFAIILRKEFWVISLPWKFNLGCLGFII